ncbi:MAG: class I SAM-dependent methyltransferase [Bacteroidia bacterium]
MAEIAPGSILQRMYFKRRITPAQYRTFCEIGSGNGILSNILLQKGLTGVGYDLNESACKNNNELNKDFIGNNKYKVYNENFITDSSENKYDLIYSCMVIEHLDEETVNRYFEACKKKLNAGGTILVLVPSAMKYWGIEDEIAGHFKRYEFEDLRKIADQHGLKINDLAGLTYPVSNWLFGLSNRIVSKNEGHKKNLSMQEQTVQSGNRGVKFKTEYPWYFKLFLNEITMLPFYWLQRISKNNPKSMVLYCEYKLKP